MNLTLTQSIERTKDLSGELKAARAHEADCAADHEAKKRIAEIAAEAHDKACGHCYALEAEREELADHIAALVRRTGEPLPPDTSGQETAAEQPQPAWISPDGQGFNSVFTNADTFADQLMARSESKLNDAFNEATQ